jgi:hypothetical protein
MGGKKDDKWSEWADNGKCKSIFSFYFDYAGIIFNFLTFQGSGKWTKEKV